MSRVEAASRPRPFARWAEADRRALHAALLVAAAAIALRLALAPQVDGLDDAGYLEAALRVSQGQSLDGIFPLFQTRVGMAYPLGWLLQAGWLRADQFWILTVLAETVTLAALFASAWLLTGLPAAGLAAVALYAVYPLAVQQAGMYYPTVFQVAAIAGACACIALAERIGGRTRLALGFAAGVALGVGYLFKEDVAIVVPAFVLASAVARYPRWSTTVAMCVGAAVVFGAECLGYWMSTGHPLFRLTVTSGLGAPMQEQLQISEIWRWDAFVRSLFLLPAHVGAIWWFALPALWMGWRSSDSRLRFAAVAFLMLAAYLQFGSGSLTSYSPLPKTPRYTALVTPLLVVTVAAWMARHHVRRRRAMAYGSMAVIAVAAVPCILYLALASSERTRNTLAVLPALRAEAPQHLYTDYYGARVLRLLEPDLPQISVWYHARFDTRQMVVTADPATANDAYVLLDRQAAKIYTSSYEMLLPPQVAVPPQNWQLVWSHRAYGDGTVTRRLLEAVRATARSLPDGNSFRARVIRNVSDMIDEDDAALYRVPAVTGRSKTR